jgi:hypothetical protein
MIILIYIDFNICIQLLSNLCRYNLPENRLSYLILKWSIYYGYQICLPNRMHLNVRLFKYCHVSQCL